jgi:hypothetical protein
MKTVGIKRTIFYVPILDKYSNNQIVSASVMPTCHLKTEADPLPKESRMSSKPRAMDNGQHISTYINCLKLKLEL